MGMGQLCTKTLLHEGSNMHKITFLHEGTFCEKMLMHETLKNRQNKFKI